VTAITSSPRPSANSVSVAEGTRDTIRTGGKGMALLSEEDVAERLRDSAWERDGDEIAREWKFDDFAAAMAFVNRVAEAAEEANHHPDILLHGWNRVLLSLMTHSEGGLTENDFAMAARFDELA
jgi:4a-hydroxytetrahydrobiopterin dehydratase